MIINIGHGSTGTLAALTDALISSPTNNQALLWNIAAGKWENTDIPAASVTLNYLNLFGDGTDGTVTLDGTVPTNSWATKVGSVYTLSQDTNLVDLHISTGVTLKTGGWRIRGTGTCTVDSGGSIGLKANAGNADGTVGTAASSSAIASGQSGGAGNTGAGTIGVKGFTGTGGAGGLNTGSPSTGGGIAGQTPVVTSSAQFKSLMSHPFVLMSGVLVFGSTTVRALMGGTGGSGGTGDGTNKGGAGGNGGEGVGIAFKTAIVNNGTITAQGGDGGTPAAGNAGGGSAGCGGWILLMTVGAITQGTTVVTPGSPGAGVGTGRTAAASGNGLVLTAVLT